LPFSGISLTQFTARETFRALNRAGIFLDKDHVHISLRPKKWPSGLFNFRPLLVFDIVLVRGRDVLLSSLAQVCSSSVFPLSCLEILAICGLRWRGHEWSHRTDDAKSLEIFNTFTAVKKLRLCHTLGPRVAPMLRELAPERVIGMLPALEDVHFHEWDEKRYPFERTIGRFVINRQLAGYPVSFHATFGKQR
jgi:hypothetical protein